MRWPSHRIDLNGPVVVAKNVSLIRPSMDLIDRTLAIPFFVDQRINQRIRRLGLGAVLILLALISTSAYLMHRSQSQLNAIKRTVDHQQTLYAAGTSVDATLDTVVTNERTDQTQKALNTYKMRLLDLYDLYADTPYLENSPAHSSLTPLMGQLERTFALVEQRDLASRNTDLTALRSKLHDQISELLRIKAAHADTVATAHVAQLRATQAFNQWMIVFTLSAFIVLIVVMLYLLSRSITQPLAALQADVERLNSGNVQGDINLRRNDDIGQLGRTLNELLSGHIHQAGNAEIVNGRSLSSTERLTHSARALASGDFTVQVPPLEGELGYLAASLNLAITEIRNHLVLTSSNAATVIENARQLESALQHDVGSTRQQHTDGHALFDLLTQSANGHQAILSQVNAIEHDCQQDVHNPNHQKNGTPANPSSAVQQVLDLTAQNLTDYEHIQGRLLELQALAATAIQDVHASDISAFNVAYSMQPPFHQPTLSQSNKLRRDIGQFKLQTTQIKQVLSALASTVTAAIETQQRTHQVASTLLEPQTDIPTLQNQEDHGRDAMLRKIAAIRQQIAQQITNGQLIAKAGQQIVGATQSLEADLVSQARDARELVVHAEMLTQSTSGFRFIPPVDTANELIG